MIPCIQCGTVVARQPSVHPKAAPIPLYKHRFRRTGFDAATMSPMPVVSPAACRCGAWRASPHPVAGTRLTFVPVRGASRVRAPAIVADPDGTMSVLLDEKGRWVRVPDGVTDAFEEVVRQAAVRAVMDA